jgi:hypothetical protein
MTPLQAAIVLYLHYLLSGSEGWREAKRYYVLAHHWSAGAGRAAIRSNLIDSLKAAMSMDLTERDRAAAALRTGTGV